MSSIPHAEVDASRLLAKNTRSPAAPLKIEVRIETPPNEIAMAWIAHHHLFIEKVIADVEKTSARRILQPETIEALQEHERVCGLPAHTIIH